jgi:excisionase family DNA binding protein
VRNLITRETLAGERGLCKDTVTGDIRAGKLEAVRVGNRVLIPREAADAWRQPIPIEPTSDAKSKAPRS